MRVLIAEDEVATAKALKVLLEKAGCSVDIVHNGNDAWDYIEAGTYEVIVLDIMMPGKSGLEVLSLIRNNHLTVPVMLLTSKAEIEDRVAGLDAGADDYLPKPYDPKEMYARIMSLIRRYKKTNSEKEGVLADSVFRIDAKRHEIFFNDESLTLTPAEYEILEYLVKHHSFSVSREQLVYNCKSLKDKDSKSLDVIIGRLRTKIGDNSKSPKHICSVRGIGYKLIG